MEEMLDSMSFDMGSLKTNLPQKRGLSRYYAGKSRSFACIQEVKCVGDLEKKEHQKEKRRKKCLDRKQITFPPPYPCLSNFYQTPLCNSSLNHHVHASSFPSFVG